jgi:hypothetical protein
MPSDLPGASPLDPEIAALLERERSDPFGDPTGVGKAALARRLEHAALAIAATGTLPLLGAAAEAARKALAPHVTSAASSAPHAKGLLAWGLASKVGAASILVLGGGITGALLEARYEAPPSPPVPVVTPAPTQPRAAPSALPSPVDSNEPAIPSVSVDSLPSVAPPTSIRSPGALASASASASAHTTPSRGEERVLLDTARAAIARGAYSAALTTLSDDAERFPQGKLVEERELLFVQALAGAGQRTEAAARARAFEATFPQSIFLPAVRAASSTKEP